MLKPIAKVIGFFGIIQLVGIAGAWLLTRTFRKMYATSDLPPSMRPDPGLGMVFADYGWLCLLLPVIWCGTIALVLHREEMTHTGTGPAVRIGLISTAVTLLFFGWIACGMMHAAISPPEGPLKPLNTHCVTKKKLRITFRRLHCAHAIAHPRSA